MDLIKTVLTSSKLYQSVEICKKCSNTQICNGSRYELSKMPFEYKVSDLSSALQVPTPGQTKASGYALLCQSCFFLWICFLDSLHQLLYRKPSVAS